MILWPVIALLALALAVGTVRYGLPALEHRKHTKALTRIAVLERELGIGRDFADEIALAQRSYEQGLSLMMPEPGARVLGQCDSCKRRVVLNAGRCYGGGPKCAKSIFARKLRA